MRIYCAFWDEGEHRFKEPVTYDFTYPVGFPHIILNAKDMQEAKEKIELINIKAKGKDRFDFDTRRILLLALHENANIH
ncbi:MAG: hypothetical protein QG670_2201 [Thermoproteota archaeon]|nr:hypothetical protein [Thermoproteota archaeon]